MKPYEAILDLSLVGSGLARSCGQAGEVGAEVPKIARSRKAVLRFELLCQTKLYKVMFWTIPPVMNPKIGRRQP